MSDTKITLQDLYTVTNRIEKKLDRMEERVSALEYWKADIMGKVTMAVAIISFLFTITWDWIKQKINS